MPLVGGRRTRPASKTSEASQTRPSTYYFSEPLNTTPQNETLVELAQNLILLDLGCIHLECVLLDMSKFFSWAPYQCSQVPRLQAQLDILRLEAADVHNSTRRINLNYLRDARLLCHWEMLSGVFSWSQFLSTFSPLPYPAPVEYFKEWEMASTKFAELLIKIAQQGQLDHAMLTVIGKRMLCLDETLRRFHSWIQTPRYAKTWPEIKHMIDAAMKSVEMEQARDKISEEVITAAPSTSTAKVDDDDLDVKIIAKIEAKEREDEEQECVFLGKRKKEAKDKTARKKDVAPSAPPRHESHPDEYTVGWICALSHELAASRAMLDKMHRETYTHSQHDHNIYTLGEIGGHKVVMACLPNGSYGIPSAATVAKDMLRSFTSIRFGLMVGIGGGIPTAKNDIRLGDVVVSMPTADHGGIIQYDTGKILPGGVFERRGAQNKPPLFLLNAVSSLRAAREMGNSKIAEYVSEMRQKYPNMKAQYANPGVECDELYESECDHASSVQCDRCGKHRKITRQPRLDHNGRADNRPYVHYGLIASGNKVIGSAKERDRLRRKEDILCFEMEAAGLMDSFPCLVIRGISDYADAHKRNEWQRYAAATAAAYAKELLYNVPRPRVLSADTARKVISA